MRSAPRHFVAPLLALLLISGLLLGSCGSPAPLVEVARSEKPRRQTPQVGGDLPALAGDNRAFALDLYHALRTRNGNLFFSPYSISQALAMTYAGARGQTAEQMAGTLHFSLPPERLHPAFNALDQALAAAANNVELPPYGSGEQLPGFSLKIANSLWGQTGHPFQLPFLDTLAENYGAGLRLLDFKGAPAVSRDTINGWVSEQTNGKLKELIPTGAIDDNTRLVLANAIAFEGAWAYPFREENTGDGSFHLLNGGTVSAPMMKQTEALRYLYAEESGYQTIQLDYTPPQRMSILILLPAPGQFAAFESALDARRVDAIVGRLSPRLVTLTMPKFAYTSPSVSLKQTLGELGMVEAFAPQHADFSGMDGDRDLYLGDVFHQASVSVHEKGTEAVAATVSIMQAVSAPVEPPLQLAIDRPFIFLIRDNNTGALLFAGRVLDPRG